MKYKQFGSSDLKVSEICLGSMTWGVQNSTHDAVEQLDYAVAQGINFIDTAEMYPVPPTADTYGRTEAYIGAWLRNQQRDKLVIATKIAGPGRAWVRGGPRINRSHVSRAIDDSLQRLQTDYVDLYQIHWPDRNVPVFGGWFFDASKERATEPLHQQLEALAEIVKAGKVRYIGLSNETPWGTMEFLRLAREHNLPRVMSVQNAYNLINRSFEWGMSEVCFRENVGLMAYSVLAFGHLSGKYAADPKALGRLTLFDSFGQRYEKPNVPAAVRDYVKLAKQAGVSPSTLAHAFVKTRFFVTSAIIGATNMTQLKENIQAFDTDLSVDVLKAIDDIHLRYTNPAP